MQRMDIIFFLPRVVLIFFSHTKIQNMTISAFNKNTQLTVIELKTQNVIFMGSVK
jgi:hypothetical protein